MRLEEARNAVEASARLGAQPVLSPLFQALESHGFSPAEVGALWDRYSIARGEGNRNLAALKYVIYDIFRRARDEVQWNHRPQADLYRARRDLAALSLLAAECALMSDDL